MSEMYKKQNGIEPINDNELEAVAGGAAKNITPQQAEAQAKADGRLIPFKSKDSAAAYQICGCDIEYKWARSDTVLSVRFSEPQKGYSDIKCYCCGRKSNGIIIK